MILQLCKKTSPTINLCNIYLFVVDYIYIYIHIYIRDIRDIHIAKQIYEN